MGRLLSALRLGYRYTAHSQILIVFFLKNKVLLCPFSVKWSTVGGEEPERKHTSHIWPYKTRPGNKAKQFGTFNLSFKYTQQCITIVLP